MSETPKEIEVDINEASHPQLLHFAKIQNLDLDPSWSKSQLLVRVKKAWPHGTIKVSDEVEPVPTFIPPELTASKEKVRVIVSQSDDDKEGTIEGGVNGVSYILQRGVEVDVSPEIYETLKNAVALHYDPLREGGLSDPRKIQAVPVTRVK